MSPSRRRPVADVGDLEPTEAESRRSSRERALELSYEAEAKGVTVGEVLAGLPVAPDPLAVELVTGAERHRDRIDAVLARLVAPRWSLPRLAAVDRAILRMAAYELLEVPERSPALVINEAVVLARRFGTDDSPRFVNGVLSSVAAEARPGGTTRRPAAGEPPDGKAGEPPDGKGEGRRKPGGHDGAGAPGAPRLP
ncbi:MAG TPA: transcription antitermination factor NusB [Acidimicrobiales bacterium]|nr:transcription antitermination factor NusB [Acidimicrobiales bacterium]